MLMPKRTHIAVLTILLVLVLSVAQVRAKPQYPQDEGVAPTYTVFATREGLVGHTTANGHVIEPRDRFVALPSWDVLSSYHGQEYQVRITYQGCSVVAPVWDVGPWNTNDDYWSPDRTYGDLPVGVPMAQAAHLEGYHGGLDEQGRTISLPNGIDIADGTFWDDLGMTKSDWVQVSFLWLGSDPGPGNAANVLPPPTRGQQDIPAGRPSTDWQNDWDTVPTAPAAPAAPASQPLDNPVVEDYAIAVDNSDTAHSTNDAPWYSANCGLNGSHAWTYATDDPAKSENHAIWRPSLTPGHYEVKAYIPPCGEVGATGSARYRITYNGKVTEVSLDQAAAAGTWASLGSYDFGGEGPHLVELSDLTRDSNRSVRFDVVSWVPANAESAEAPPPTPTEVPPDTTPPTVEMVSLTAHMGGFLLKWEGHDDLSGVESYDLQVRKLTGGGWRTWLEETRDTEDWFGPAEGKDFAFRIRARDRAGNVQLWPRDATIDTTQAR